METQEKISPLTGKEGAEIDINQATEWTKNHRHHVPGGVISQFFGQEILNKILSQQGCVGIRFYYANSKPLSSWQRFMKKCFQSSQGEVHLIITGVNKDGTDQLPVSGKQAEAFALKTTASAATAGTTASEGGTLGEQSVPCPGGVGCPQNALTGGA